MVRREIAVNAGAPSRPGASTVQSFLIVLDRAQLVVLQYDRFMINTDEIILFFQQVLATTVQRPIWALIDAKRFTAKSYF